MWLPFYLLLSVVGIAAAVFVIKLIVSLRVAHNAPADSVLDGGIGRSSLERLGEQEHAAGEGARAQGA